MNLKFLTGNSSVPINSVVRTPMPHVKGGFCGCRTEYAGPDPVSNYAKIACIDIIKGLFATVVVGTGSIGVWYLKEKIARKMGWIKEIPCLNEGSVGVQQSETEVVGTPITILPLNEVVTKAVANGAPRELRGKNIYEGDRVVIVSGAGVGKSILAMQLGLGIGSGKPCDVFPDECDTAPQRVLLIDAEQEEEDMFLRYGNLAGKIPSNITRISDCPFNTPEDVVTSINKEVATWNENGTVIIDNITSLFSLQSAEKIRGFYSSLRNTQNKFNERGFKLTYIILCHETKSATKLTLKTIMGSGNIGNFATSVFALGYSSLGDDMRFLKALKARRAPKFGNVYLLKLVEEPYLHFENHGEASEAEATGKTKIQEPIEIIQTPVIPGQRKRSDEQIEQIRQLYAKGESVNSLAKRFKVNRGTITKYLGKK